ncbi:FK506-binding protein 2B [Dimargaris cristalligena]|uniref:peptidylprolyl isomerase n=1 Tax=Dimargaris cristalligena TaxID=215637 RepID=A0A4P9ZYL6_9FUNG|nr:FK506-binding protein 2B [Dimargaris cristalligena]RKP38793.1 fk506-binding protein 3 [Dimargaris cristalligena]|eukprot:RKP38793.1 fk506-binding protein 3 [Dimargaris cristalligena]
MSVSPPWTEAKLATDEVSKKALLTFLHENANNEFLLAHRLKGKIVNLAKTFKKEPLVEFYNELFATQSFRQPDEVPINEYTPGNTDQEGTTTAETSVSDAPEGPPKYKKVVIKKGNKTSIPKKGDTVSCWYTGKLENGKQFDSNIPKGRKKGVALKFKGKSYNDTHQVMVDHDAGVGKVIRGWDEALLTMSVGEKAELTIEPEWAYGKKGMPEAGIPPNSKLIFEVELASIE